MKRAFIIHGWEGRPEEGWRPWLRQELQKQGFVVSVPAMPDTERPKMNEWVRHLQKIVGNPDRECYFVGHSLGCIAILRYLELLKKGEEAGGVVLVAGFSSSLGIPALESFFTTPINWAKINSACKKFVSIHSDNDPYVPLRFGKIFEEKLKAALVIEKGRGHFSGDEGTLELPIVLEKILELSK